MCFATASLFPFHLTLPLGMTPSIPSPDTLLGGQLELLTLLKGFSAE